MATLVDVWLVHWSDDEEAATRAALRANAENWPSVLTDLRDRDRSDRAFEVVSASHVPVLEGERSVVHLPPRSVGGMEREYLLNVNGTEGGYELAFLLRESGRHNRHFAWKGSVELAEDGVVLVEPADGWGLLVSTRAPVNLGR